MAITAWFGRRKTQTPTFPRSSQYYDTFCQIYKQYRPVRIVLNGDYVHYQTMILSVDAEQKVLKLDDPFPSGFAGSPGKTVTISVRTSDGQHQRYESEILEQRVKDNIPIYIVALPARVTSRQRREAFRLPVTDSMATFRGEDHTSPNGQVTKTARVKDVSATGAAFVVSAKGEYPSNTKIKKGDRINDCRIDLAGLRLDCDIHVRRILSASTAEDEITVGVEMLNLSPQGQRALEQFIIRSQRMMMRQAV